MVEKPSSLIFFCSISVATVISLRTKIVKECKVHNFSSIQGDHMRMRRADDHPCKSEIRPVVFKGEEEIKKTGRKPGQMDSFKSSFKQRRDTILNNEFDLKVGYIVPGEGTRRGDT